MPERALRIAIVGAGPAGIYSAEALVKAADERDQPMAIDLIDAVPSPFGLVRYGVAPDHYSIRSVRDALDRILHDHRIRFFGNVEVGDAIGADTAGDSVAPQQISLATLRSMYDAVILSYGAATDRSLGISGEDSQGSISATQFVAWYTGHPDTPADAWVDLLTHSTSVAVVGVGNVAIDVARILAKSAEELQQTDMPEHVLTALSNSAIRDIYIIGRRGPAEATWTTKELRELGELVEADISVRGGDTELGPTSQSMVDTSKVAARNVGVVREWVTRAAGEKRKCIHLRFFARPVAIEVVSGHATAITIESTQLTSEGAVVGTGKIERIAVDAVIRSVGYRGTALSDVPFDDDRGVVPHAEGRVLHSTGPVPGLYVAGWIKRGPSGIIGTNKKDAVNTVSSLLHDLDQGVLSNTEPARDDLADVLKNGFVDHAGWRRINDAEIALGSRRGRDRTTIHDRGESLAASHVGEGTGRTSPASQ